MKTRTCLSGVGIAETGCSDVVANRRGGGEPLFVTGRGSDVTLALMATTVTKGCRITASAASRCNTGWPSGWCCGWRGFRGAWDMGQSEEISSREPLREEEKCLSVSRSASREATGAGEHCFQHLLHRSAPEQKGLQGFVLMDTPVETPVRRGFNGGVPGQNAFGECTESGALRSQEWVLLMCGS